MLLESLPPQAKEHFENKIAVFIHWWQCHDVDVGESYQQGIPDEQPFELENAPGGQRRPSWRRIAKVLLRYDYWCKGLSFSQHKSDAYERYLKVMKSRRARWGIFAS